jgi:hypothetical protein
MDNPLDCPYGVISKEWTMSERIDVLKEAEKAKLNAAVDAEKDVLALKQDDEQIEKPSKRHRYACYGGWWGSPGFWLIALGLFFLLSSSGMGVSWWIVPLMFFILCKSAWRRC